MADVYKVQAVLTGFVGSPGVNTFYCTPGAGFGSEQDALDDFASDLYDMYFGLRTQLQMSVIVSIDQEVSKFDAVTGALLGRPGITEPKVITGNDGAKSPRQTMAKFRYNTNTIAKNRVIQGGIYFGPLGSDAYDLDGDLSAGFAAGIKAYHAPLIASGAGLRLIVWHQPKDGANGVAAPVTSVSVKPVTAVLRSRRD